MKWPVTGLALRQLARTRCVLSSRARELLIASPSSDGHFLVSRQRHDGCLEFGGFHIIPSVRGGSDKTYAVRAKLQSSV
ncbi:hypothetical protein EVAR_83867_1 [Eumeta japonica]|uniref:Uncharacterized protein n=1 Tax=Eumeta variegata TaxID=151549 RepID=A0A4C1UR95_EUMVA|nr:hypothetical protein EVAR_83867_1 [Eumeta japonica]